MFQPDTISIQAWSRYRVERLQINYLESGTCFVDTFANIRAMWKNHLTTSLRNLLRNRSSSAINLLSLIIGITISILIFTILRYQYTFDHHQTHAEEVYRVNYHIKSPYGISHQAETPQPLVKVLRDGYPQIEALSRTFGPLDVNLDIADQRLLQRDVLFVDEYFTDLFDLDWLSGNPHTALKDPKAIVLTESVARSLFAERDPLGITISLGNRAEAVVRGVVADPDFNTNLPFRMLMSWELLKEYERFYIADSWTATSIGLTWLKLHADSDPQVLEAQMQGIVTQHMEERYHDLISFHLGPLKSLHTDDRYGNVQNYTIPSITLYALLGIGLVFLITCCINFVNLSAAQTVRRAKEVGIKKLMGSSKVQIMRQLYLEMFIMVSAAAFLSLWVSEVLIHQTNQLLDVVPIDMGLTWESVLFAAVLAAAVTLVAGTYPVLLLSRSKVVDSMHGAMPPAVGTKVFVRKSLLTLQFAFSQMLLIVVIVFIWQFYYIGNKELGYQADHIFNFSNFSPSNPEAIALAKAELKKHPAIHEVSFGNGGPNALYSWGTIVKDPQDTEGREIQVDYKHADIDYNAIFEFDLVAGSWFFPADYHLAAEQQKIVINEMLVARFGWESAAAAIGKKVEINGAMATVSGVVRDFHNDNFKSQIWPVAIEGDYEGYMQGFIKHEPGSYKEVAEHFTKVAGLLNPSYLPEYRSYRQELIIDYTLDQTLFKLIVFVAILAIIVSCLGLYSLTAFIAQQKTKEIGIRKVVGAQLSNIFVIISTEFVLALLIAFILASPSAWYISSLWLESYIYHIELGPAIFLLAFAITVLIALLSVGYRVYRAANANPVTSLRYE